MRRKIIFLDIDGVLNSQDWYHRRTKTSPDCTREEFDRNQFDPEAVKRLRTILGVTQAEVVLSSVWRLGEESCAAVRQNACDFIDVTPQCSSGIRGAEIMMWIRKNIPGYYDEGVLQYAIIDDDSDMLLWQKDNFFQTSNDHGLTDEIVDRVIKHFE